MRSETAAKLGKVLAVVGVLLCVAVIFVAPIEEAAAFIVAVLCCGGALFGLSFTSDPHERVIVMRLFCIAFALRLAFTYVAYKTGLTKALGGEDDIGWIQCWVNSRYWRHWQPHPPTKRGVPGMFLPASIKEIYDGSHPANMGFHYFGAYFYYLLNVPSQMALSMLNCFMNSMTVVVLYKACRVYFSEKASKFAAGAAIILPGFLAWSALSIKETWVILFEIAGFYFILLYSRERRPIYIAGALILTGLVLGIRFYVAYILVVGGIFTILCSPSPRPWRTALIGVGCLATVLAMLIAVRVVHFDLSAMAQARIGEMENFRNGASGKWGGVGARAASGVELDYDIKTPGGAAMMIVVGSAYLLLSPFPWQIHNARQAAALPDVALWWFLAFGFIIPGIVYCTRRQPGLLLSLASFTLPLILFYSLIFGNVGLAYRQRAQLMPFLLMLAAAGYEGRQRKSKVRSLRTRLAPMLHSLEAPPLPIGSPVRAYKRSAETA